MATHSSVLAWRPAAPVPGGLADRAGGGRRPRLAAVQSPPFSQDRSLCAELPRLLQTAQEKTQSLQVWINPPEWPGPLGCGFAPLLPCIHQFNMSQLLGLWDSRRAVPWTPCPHPVLTYHLLMAEQTRNYTISSCG